MRVEAPRDPEVILSEIRKKTNLIIKQLARRDAGKFKSAQDAATLQRLQHERQQLVLELPPLRLIQP